jgi:hypothetical protein
LLSSGSIKILVNRTEVVPCDPLYWDDPDTIKYTDGWTSVKGYETLEYRCVSIRKVATQAESRTTNQGLSWIRNQREIGYNITEPFWKRYPDHRGFLVEVRYNGGELDSEVSLNVQKKLEAGSLSQSLIDVLAQEIMPFQKRNIMEYRKEQKEKKKLTSTEVDEKLESFARTLKHNSKSLHQPERQPDVRNQNNSNSSDKKNKKAANPKKGSVEAHKSSHLGRNFTFSENHWTATGPMMEPSLEGNNVDIGFNYDHPLIAKIIANEGSTSFTSFLTLFSAMGLAQLMLPEDEDIAIAFTKFMSTFNLNCGELVNKTS